MTQVQQVRHECLLQLYGSKEIPLSAAHIWRVARKQGCECTEREVREALFFLAGQGFCEAVPNPVTGEVRQRITSRGMLAWEGRLE